MTNMNYTAFTTEEKAEAIRIIKSFGARYEVSGYGDGWYIAISCPDNVNEVELGDALADIWDNASAEDKAEMLRDQIDDAYGIE